MEVGQTNCLHLTTPTALTKRFTRCAKMFLSLQVQGFEFLFATLMILKKVGGVDMFDEGHQPSKIPVSYGSASSTHGENLLEVIF